MKFKLIHLKCFGYNPMVQEFEGTEKELNFFLNKFNKANKKKK